VSGKHRTPHVAILVTAVLSVLICVYAAAFAVITSISTICLYLAYGIPIWLNARKRQVTPAMAPWNLGRWSPLVNWIAIVWIVVICIIFLLPPNELVLYTMVGVALFLAVYWKMRGR